MSTTDDLRPALTATEGGTEVAVVVRPPRGATDPIWYLAADYLCPHMARSKMRAWMEGFVAALEAARGIDGDDDGLSHVLQSSIGLAVAVPTMSIGVEPLARFLFDRQAREYNADDDMIEAAWQDPGVHEFWMEEAEAVLAFLP